MRLLATISLCMIATPVLAAEADQLLADTRARAVPVLPQVAAMMKDTVHSEGVAAAIPVCKDKAPALLATKARELGWELRRVSLRTRNAERATPDPWEVRQLADFDTRAARGEEVAGLEAGEIVSDAEGRRWFRYMKAIPVGAVCLQCHGDAAQLAPELARELAQSYPQDQATGYQLGEIRGALSVRRPL